jgi:hypothetical protein
MKTPDYKAILSAVERALAICDDPTTSMDQTHRRICEDLRRARDELVRLIGSGSSPVA